MKELIYPTTEKIVEYNILVLSIIKTKKADKPSVLSKSKLMTVIMDSKHIDGDAYDKAVVLLKGLVQKHPFASGNRRTAFIVVKSFLLENGETFKIKDDPSLAKTMLGIREGYYSDADIKDWLKHGTIREFKR